MINSAIEQKGGIDDGNTDVLWNALNLGNLLKQDKVIPPKVYRVVVL